MGKSEGSPIHNANSRADTESVSNCLLTGAGGGTFKQQARTSELDLFCDGTALDFLLVQVMTIFDAHIACKSLPIRGAIDFDIPRDLWQ